MIDSTTDTVGEWAHVTYVNMYAMHRTTLPAGTLPRASQTLLRQTWYGKRGLGITGPDGASIYNAGLFR